MDENQSLFELEIDTVTAEELVDTTRWQKMLGFVLIAIIGLIITAFVLGRNSISVLLGDLIGGENGQAAIAVIVVVVFILVGITVTMSWLLIRGARRVKSAIRKQDQMLFNKGLNDLKIFFIILGVINIIELIGNLSIFF